MNKTEYDFNGNTNYLKGKVKYFSECNFDNNGKQWSKIIYSFDKDGNTLESRIYSKEGDLREMTLSKYDLNTKSSIWRKETAFYYTENQCEKNPNFDFLELSCIEVIVRTGSPISFLTRNEYRKDGSLIIAETTQYDKNTGNKLEFLRYNKCENYPRVKPTLRVVLSYDNNGKEIESKTYINGTISKVITTKRKVTGDIKEIQYYEKDEDAPYMFEVIVYNIWGKETKYVRSDVDGVVESSRELKYDSNGNLVEHKDFGKEGVLNCKTSYKYDSGGNEIERIETNQYEKIRFREVTQYDNDNNVTVITNYNGDGYLSHKTTYEYDQKGNWVREKSDIPFVGGFSEREIEYYD